VQLECSWRAVGVQLECSWSAAGVQLKWCLSHTCISVGRLTLASAGKASPQRPSATIERLARSSAETVPKLKFGSEVEAPVEVESPPTETTSEAQVPETKPAA
jgi:hypothetical protein